MFYSELRASKSLRDLFYVILIAGNFINGVRIAPLTHGFNNIKWRVFIRGEGYKKGLIGLSIMPVVNLLNISIFYVKASQQ